MRRRPPRSTRTDTLFPYTTLFRSPLIHGEILPSSISVQLVRHDKVVEHEANILLRLDDGQNILCHSSHILVMSAEATQGSSEEHTSELQSLMRISYAVFCLKKTTTKHITHNTNTHSTTRNNN